jgi:Lrp/AsnC family transcriptional regulator for asnA, asnC and gidA
MADDLIFDSTDKKILKYLIRDARVKVVDIASYVGVTAAAIHQRLAKIKKAGIIKGFTVRLNERALGYKTCAFVGVFMSKNSQYKEVVEQLLAIEEVVEAHYTTGQYALFVKLYAKDNDHLMQVLNRKVQQIKGITQTETFISLEEPISRSLPI